jgi:hypothetical protein
MQKRMGDINKDELKKKIEQVLVEKPDFNLYRFIGEIE